MKKKIKDVVKKTKLLLGIENDDSELAKFLKGQNVPFKLPDYMEVHLGYRHMSDRGKLLMLAGLGYLKEKYPVK